MRIIIKSLVIAVSFGLFLSAPLALAAGKEREEQTLRASDVPTAVRHAAESQAKGGKIVRWEKEGENYEAVIEKKGKQWGVEISADGKVLGKHDESKEHK
jgi:hypothetical protein